MYSRTGKGGSARGGTAAELFEFDQNMKFVKMWGPDNYAASFAHSVRVDKYDNVWMVDEGSGMIVKFDPNGMVKMTLGRKPEAIDYMERYIERGEKDTERYPVGSDGHIQPANRHGVGFAGQYVRERWLWQLARRQDSEGRHLGEGGGNTRFRRQSVQHAAWHRHGRAGQRLCRRPRQQPHPGLRLRSELQEIFGGVGAPWTVQVTPKYIYSGDGTGKIYRLDHDGKLLGWAQTGMGMGQTGCIIHELHAVSDNVLIRGSCSEWNVTKITFK